MSWNFPHPPPPPPGAGPHPGPPHPPPPPPPYSNSPFWDFINSFGPSNRPAGAGVDHADTDSPHGFTFGPSGFNAWSGRHGFQGSWGGPGRRGSRHRHGRCQHCPADNDDDESSSSSGDEEMRDTNRPATMTPETGSPPGQEGVTDEKRDSPATMRDENENGEVPDPPEDVPSSPPRGGRQGGRCGRGRHGHGPTWGRGGRHGGRCGPHRGHSHGRPYHHHHPHHPRGPPPPPGGPPPHPPFPFSFPFGGGSRGGNGGPGGGAFDFNAMMNAFTDHPFARGLREHWDEIQQHRQQRRDQAAASNRGEQPSQAQHNHDDDSGTFVPPVDIFNTSNNWTLHVAIPGAKTEDVNVHWDADRSTLLISGLVYRPGDEEFLNTLVAAERRVGLFERRVQLPPAGISHNEDGEKEEVDADHITARMEDGILVVAVPKVEKEWTEVKKVDIE